MGVRHGPEGVALAYSVALLLLLIPIAAMSKHGTRITWTDLWRATRPSFLCGLLAGAAGLFVKLTLDGKLAPVFCLMLGFTTVLGIYVWALVIVMRQKQMFMDVLSQLLPRPEPTQEGTAEQR